MAHQIVAQSGAPVGRSAQMGKRRVPFLRKVVEAWKTTYCYFRYLLVGAGRGVPGLVDFVCGNHFFSAIQLPGELRALGEILAVRRPERALEIGTCRGGTLFFLSRLAGPQATIVSVDLPGGEFGGGYGRTAAWFYKRFARRGQRFELLLGDSHTRDMFDKVKTALRGQQLDFLFIDGDHSYSGVKCDFEMYGPIVRKGGLIALHDIAEGPLEHGGGVPQLWRDVKSKFRHIEIVKGRQQAGYGIGVLYVDEQSPVECTANLREGETD
jgi:predicted O-methyltransferase YrrM